MMTTHSEWLNQHGRPLSDYMYSDDGFRIAWEPLINPDRYVQVCYGETIDEAYTKTYEAVKQELFDRCG